MGESSTHVCTRCGWIGTPPEKVFDHFASPIPMNWQAVSVHRGPPLLFHTIVTFNGNSDYESYSKCGPVVPGTVAGEVLELPEDSVEALITSAVVRAYGEERGTALVAAMMQRLPIDAVFTQETPRDNAAAPVETTDPSICSNCGENLIVYTIPNPNPVCRKCDGSGYDGYEEPDEP